jgi:hypothetical protein
MMRIWLNLGMADLVSVWLIPGVREKEITRILNDYTQNQHWFSSLEG